MPGVLVDSDVLLDVLTEDPEDVASTLPQDVLLTRDPRRYRTYCPRLLLVAP